MELPPDDDVGPSIAMRPGAMVMVHEAERIETPARKLPPPRLSREELLLLVLVIRTWFQLSHEPDVKVAHCTTLGSQRHASTQGLQRTRLWLAARRHVQQNSAQTLQG